MTTKLASPPIVEAVVDIDCDLPPSLDVGTLEAEARAAFAGSYPKFQVRLLQEHTIQAPAEGEPKLSVRRGLQALQFVQGDDRQLVQVRPGGYSFNRLAPYTSLDDYLPEIQSTWETFRRLAAPIEVRQIRLRYINRIPLPLTDGRVDLDTYLAIGPHPPEEKSLTFTGFVHRHALLEPATNNRVNVTLASEAANQERLPIILDIEVIADASIDPADWGGITGSIQGLRSLKNLVFERTLTLTCLKLF